MRRIMANDNDDNTDASTYDTSVTNVSDVDALVMMPVAMIMMLIPRRLQPNHGNCAHSDVDNDPANDNDNDRIMIMIILVSGEEGGGGVHVTAGGEC